MQQILGSCFFVGGLKSRLVTINKEVAGILTSLLIISCVSLIVPSSLYAVDTSSSDPRSGGPEPYILALSRSTSIVLLGFYGIYLVFQMKTHKNLFADHKEDDAENDANGDHPVEAPETEVETVANPDKIPPLASAIVLIITTIGVSVSSDFLVDSVDGLVEMLGVSRSFIGLIVVPIVGNASCFVATVQWALDDKMDLSVGVIVESTLQISLFVTPFLVILGWIIGSPMSLEFDQFETIVLTVSVLVVNCLVRDGSTNYFEGLLLICT